MLICVKILYDNRSNTPNDSHQEYKKETQGIGRRKGGCIHWNV